MHGSIRTVVAALSLVCILGSAWGQNVALDDPPKLAVRKQPPTRQEIEQRDALKQYVLGLLYQHEAKFLEALGAFEEAARLDPESPALVKAQVPVLIAMERLTDALGACKTVVRLDPSDYATWYAQAKIHKVYGRYPDAIDAMERGLKSARLTDHPEAAQQMYFELGNLCESAERPGPAADAYNKAAAILEHPDSIMRKGPFPREAIEARAAETYEKIGQLYRKAKQYDSAITALRKAQEHAPDRASRLDFQMAQICREKGDLKQAITFVDGYLRSQPLGVEAYEMKIDLLHRQKESATIVPWLEAAGARDRFNTGLQILLAREYTRARQTTKAEQLYQKLVDDAPTAELYRGLFHVYKLDGPAGMTRTLILLNKALDRPNTDNGNPAGVSVTRARAMVNALREDAELAKELVSTAFKQTDKWEALNDQTIYFLAVLADRHKQFNEAEKFFARCLKQANPANEAEIYNGLLTALGRTRKYAAMVEVCERGLKVAKATAPLLFHDSLVRAYTGLRRYDDALKEVDLCIARAGDVTRLSYKLMRINILANADRFADAEAECKTLLKTHDRPSEQVKLHYQLSGVYSAAKQHAKAEEQLQIILKIDPYNATVNNDLGYLWADQNKKLDVAEDMIRKAIDLDRSQRRKNPNFTLEEDHDNSAYVDSLGWVLYRRGQIKEARTELERAVSLGDGDDPVIYEHLGDVYHRLSMHPEASRAWQRALELYNEGIRHKDDDRVRDIQRKLEQVKAP